MQHLWLFSLFASTSLATPSLAALPQIFTVGLGEYLSDGSDTGFNRIWITFDDPATKTSAKCYSDFNTAKLNSVHSQPPTEWTVCDDRSFSWRTETWNGDHSFRLGLRHQYRRNGKPCIRSDGPECITRLSYVEFNTSAPGYVHHWPLTAGGSGEEHLSIGPFSVPVYYQCLSCDLDKEWITVKQPATTPDLVADESKAEEEHRARSVGDSINESESEAKIMEGCLFVNCMRCTFAIMIKFRNKLLPMMPKTDREQYLNTVTLTICKMCEARNMEWFVHGSQDQDVLVSHFRDLKLSVSMMQGADVMKAAKLIIGVHVPMLANKGEVEKVTSRDTMASLNTITTSIPSTIEIHAYNDSDVDDNAPLGTSPTLAEIDRIVDQARELREDGDSEAAYNSLVHGPLFALALSLSPHSGSVAAKNIVHATVAPASLNPLDTNNESIRSKMVDWAIKPTDDKGLTPGLSMEV